MDKTVIHSYLERLKSLSLTVTGAIEGWTYKTADYLEPGEHGQWSGEKPLTGALRLPSDKTIMIETVVKFPENIKDDDQYKDYMFIKFEGGEGILRVDGETYHGIDENRCRIPIRTQWAGQEKTLGIELFGYATKKDRFDTLFEFSYFGRIDKRIEKFYFDLMLANDTYNLDNNIVKRKWGDLNASQRAINNSLSQFTKGRILKAIGKSLQYLDINLPEDELVQSVNRAGEILEKELGKIDDGSVKGHVSLIGHTHIDVAWLWQIKDTVRKCGHSFANMIRLMEEYPHFIFSASQPQLYQYTKEYYPEIYEQIKKYVKEGRWEIVGPMWVESDCNVISGESLIRQILYGRQFFLDEFSTESDICWLPDVFGFQANMPQILKKCGVNYFFSYKLHWQAQNRFPYGNFKWRGIDGSEVIAAVPELYSGYNGKPYPWEIKYAQDENLQKDYLDDVIFTYGWGDGGGGPTHEMIEYVNRLKDYPGVPRCSLNSAGEFFEKIREKENLLPVWYGELYLETHRGTLTSQGKVKKMNRKAEILYQNIEKLSVMTGLGLDKGKIKEGWEKILLLQFHDILPGSSIGEVYDDSDITYGEIMDGGNELMAEMAGKFKGDDHITVANTLSWSRDETLSLRVEGDQVRVETMDGESVESHVTEDGFLIFHAQNIPPMGFKTYRIKGEKGNAGAESPISIVDTGDGLNIKTPFYNIGIDQGGRITGLYDIEEDLNVIDDEPANEFRIFLDGPQGEDAWNIYEEYKTRRLDYNWKNNMSVVENNSQRTVIRVEKTAQKTSIIQDIILYSHDRRIDFKTVIDWKERNKVLKAAFPVNINAPYVACEVGYGTLLRPVNLNDPYDKAKFEVSAHKWVDLSEGEYGVSLLNDCKYGHDTDKNTMSVTLLRGTVHPDPDGDLGVHEITYSLYPHRGDWRGALTARRGHELNNPPVVYRGKGEDGLINSLLNVDNVNIIIDTVKRAEDGRGIILRAYECNGNRGRGRLTLTTDILEAYETSLVEEDMGKADFMDSHIEFVFEPYEIKSWRVVEKE